MKEICVGGCIRPSKVCGWYNVQKQVQQDGAGEEGAKSWICRDAKLFT